MSSGQWETVGRNKKDKITNQNKKSEKQKKPVPVVTKLEDVLPASQVKSLYSNKNNKENKKPQEKTKEMNNKQTKQGTKKPSENKPKLPKTVESALNLINIDDMKSLLEDTKKRFPDAPVVWLKELASALNTKVSIEINDPVFSSRSEGYPLSAVPNGIKQVMDKAYKDAGKTASQQFFDVCLTAMAVDMSKGQSSLGHKIWIQYLAFNEPQVVVAHLDKHISLKTSYQNRPPIGLSILWALGQGGVKDFNIGLKVFKEFMLPLLEQKNYSRFIVKYLGQLLKHRDVTLTKDNYQYIWDFINGKHSVANEVSQEILGLNKDLRALILAQKHSLFEPTLVKLSGSNNIKKEISETLLSLIIKDSATSFSTWKQNYNKTLQQSCYLLKYIKDHWKDLSGKIDVKAFKQLLKSFLDSNKQLESSNKKDSFIKESNNICKVSIYSS